MLVENKSLIIEKKPALTPSVEKTANFSERRRNTFNEAIINIKDKIGDLYFNLISIMYRLGINPDELPQYAANTLSKFEERKNLYKENL